jgi:hypothetical protein
MGITTVAGGWAGTVGLPSVALLKYPGCMPPLNVLKLIYLIHPFVKRKFDSNAEQVCIRESHHKILPYIYLAPPAFFRFSSPERTKTCLPAEPLLLIPQAREKPCPQR